MRIVKNRMATIIQAVWRGHR